MEPNDDISWLEYYQAVKRGDLTTVQLSGKNCRLPLTLYLSAFQLAAAYGHVELVQYFLSQCGKNDREFILTAAGNADYKCAKLLIEHAEPLGDNEVIQFAIAMVENGDLDCVRLVDLKRLRSVKREDLHSWAMVQLVDAAFRSGSTDSLRFVYELYENVSKKYIEEQTCVPELWFVVALDSLAWKIESYKESDFLEEVSTERFRAIQYRAELPSHSSCFDVAAYFGKLEMLKFLKRAVESSPDHSEHLAEKLESAMGMALHKNRMNVVRYLVENELVTPKPPYEYDYFRINDAFYYLWHKTKQNVQGGTELPVNWRQGWKQYRGYKSNFFTDVESEMYDGPVGIRKNICEADNYFKSLLEIGDEICRGNYREIFMESLSQQNVEAALRLRKRVGEFNCESTSNFHECWRKALRCYTIDDMEILPSPVIVELALCTLDDEKRKLTCTCSTLHPMDYLLESQDVSSGRHESQHMDPDLEYLIKGTDVILDVLVRHGCTKPDGGDVMRTMNAFFTSTTEQPVFAAKLLSLLRSCRLRTSQIVIDVESSGDWFHEYWNWHERDYFLTEFLLALAANDGFPEVDFDGLLVYAMEPPRRAQHYINCLEQTRNLKINDHLTNDPIAWQSSSFSAVIKAASSGNSRMLSLQSLCRFPIHQYCLKVAAEKTDRFMSAKLILRRIVAMLPHLSEYLLFADTHETTEPLQGDGSELVQRILNERDDSSDEEMMDLLDILGEFD